MPITTDRLCPCHGLPMYRTASGKHACIVKRRARSIRYQATAKGRAAKHRAVTSANARKVRIGQRYVGLASTPAEAEVLYAYIQRRLTDYTQEQRCRLVEIHGKSAS